MNETRKKKRKVREYEPKPYGGGYSHSNCCICSWFYVTRRLQKDGPEERMATLAKKTAFIAFMVSNSLAMLLSLYALFMHFWTRFQAAMLNKYELISVTVPTLACTFFAILAMAVAFVTGTYTVISCFPGLAIPLCIQSCSFFIFAFNFLYRSYKWLDEEDRIPFLRFAI
ncbi:hypothetical protein MKX01_029409 [Papaver californicum]|nr:hypothetical protein MKX01_029409 [Papaver californicum]